MELKSKMSVYFRDEDLQAIQAVCSDKGIEIETVPNLSTLVMKMVGKIANQASNTDEDVNYLSYELQTARNTIESLKSEIQYLKAEPAQTIDAQEYADLKTKFETLQADYNLIVSQAQTMVSTDDAELQTLKAENAKLKSEIVQLSGMVHQETKVDNNKKTGNWFTDRF